MNLADEKWETVRDFPNYMISSESRVLRKDTLRMKSLCYNKRFRFRYVRLHKNGHAINISENMKHSFDFGLGKGQFKKGLGHQLSKLSKEDVYAIRELREKNNMKYADIGKIYGITMEHAYRVAKRKIHANV